MYFDTHAHYDDEKFNIDREEVIEKAKLSDVDYIVNNACSIESCHTSIALAEKFDFIYATVGIHPHDAESMTEEVLSEIERLANHEKVVAIGEIGLDYYYDNSPRDIQRYWFKRQLELAKKIDMPVTVHNRDAHGDTLEILKDADVSGIIHCFSGSKEMAKILVDMGFYIAFGGSLTFKNSKNAVESAAVVPIERLLIETDCPYLAPEGHRGKRNDSSLIGVACAKLAEIKCVSLEEMAKITLENAKKVYRIE